MQRPLPERFGRVLEYALGKTSGKANIRKNLEALGIDMDEGSMRKVTERIIELGDKKEMVTPEDLPYIISDVLHHDNALEDQKIRILNYSLSLAQGLKPVATLKIEINGEAYEESVCDGTADACSALTTYSRLNRPFPMLTNYSVSIPPGGRTDAFACRRSSAGIMPGSISRLRSDDTRPRQTDQGGDIGDAEHIEDVIIKSVNGES